MNATLDGNTSFDTVVKLEKPNGLIWLKDVLIQSQNLLLGSCPSEPEQITFDRICSYCVMALSGSIGSWCLVLLASLVMTWARRKSCDRMKMLTALIKLVQSTTLHKLQKLKSFDFTEADWQSKCMLFSKLNTFQPTIMARAYWLRHLTLLAANLLYEHVTWTPPRVAHPQDLCGRGFLPCAYQRPVRATYRIVNTPLCVSSYNVYIAFRWLIALVVSDGDKALECDLFCYNHTLKR